MGPFLTRTKYVLCPGWVRSQNDGDRHYIQAWKLARLYGVPPEECITFDPPNGWPSSLIESAMKAQDLHGLIRLYPRSDGDYTIPQPPPTTDRSETP